MSAAQVLKQGGLETAGIVHTFGEYEYPQVDRVAGEPDKGLRSVLAAAAE